MFSKLTEKFKQIVASFKIIQLNEKSLKAPLAEIFKTLIEHDVAEQASQSLVHQLKAELLEKKIDKRFTIEQYIAKTLHAKVVNLLGEHENIACEENKLTCVMLVGLQGSGKTTLTAKMAFQIAHKAKLEYLEKNKNHPISEPIPNPPKILIVSCDTYRPAARLQLQQLLETNNITNADYFTYDSKNPEAIAQAALVHAKNNNYNYLLVDTAGRLHIDDNMMSEALNIYKLLSAEKNTLLENIFVLDSMIGQDAIIVAKAFHDNFMDMHGKSGLTGIAMTKLDGDANGGSILSVKHVTKGIPIKFISDGEHIDNLQEMLPERIASRILGMGDVLSLADELQKKIDQEKTDKIAKKLQKGGRFNLNDYKTLLIQMKKMGNMSSMLGKLPIMGANTDDSAKKIQDKIKKSLAIIDSMTKKEITQPHIVVHNGSRKKRISKGSGTNIVDINKMFGEYKKFDKMSKKLKNMENNPAAFKQIQKMMGGAGPLNEI